MRIEDNSSACDATDTREIEEALGKRFDKDMNSFWLSHGDEKYPAINLLGNGDLAYLCYWPNEDHAGFNSIGGREGLKADEAIIFFLSEATLHEMPNEYVVSFSDALKVAQGFVISKGLPKSIP